MTKELNTKVYCENCTYFHRDRASLFEGCLHESNHKYRSSPVRLISSYGDCSKLNKDNNCTLFEKEKVTLYSMLMACAFFGLIIIGLFIFIKIHFFR